MIDNALVISKKEIEDKIYIIRGQKVMLDSDLAKIYGYTTKAFNQQVQRNIEKFDDDFMFQLTDEELQMLSRSQNVTSMQTKGVKGGRVYNPYVFTEQGVYMLMTVLKGELAIKQSKALIRIFKEMKDYIIDLNDNISKDAILKLSLQVNQNMKEIKEIKEKMTTHTDLSSVIKKFIPNSQYKELLLLNGETVEASLAYRDIYNLAEDKIFIIDNYINIKTLILLKEMCNKEIIIFSDNVGNGLSLIEYNEFMKEYSDVNIKFKKTNNLFHDRYIILDYGLSSERIYHCGASSKDAGKRINTIMEIQDACVYETLIKNILNNDKLILK